VSVTVTFGDLARAAYCPRQLYYARREGDDGGLPAAVDERIDLAFRYGELRRASDSTLASLPIEPGPSAYRDALDRLATRDDWADLRDPPAERVRLHGRDCRGVVHKLVGDGVGGGADSGWTAETDGDGRDDGTNTSGGGSGGPDGQPPPTPTLVSPGEPPDRGVWEPQRVRAVAAAKALAWECGRAVDAALVEYPAYGVVRRVRLTTHNRAIYRRTLRTVRGLDGPPPRLDDDARCGACDYRSQCGVRSRSLRSLLGL
jgi:CRISPR-associated exonuclease Cas4